MLLLRLVIDGGEAMRNEQCVGLIFGGRSGEHEISIRSARAVVDTIDRGRFALTLIGIGRDGRWHLHSEESFGRLTDDAGAGAAAEVVLAPRGGSYGLIDLGNPGRDLPRLDLVFPVLHGPFGEDGTIQGLLDMLGVPYVGAGVLGSAVGMDKDVQKRLLREAGFPVVRFEVFTQRAWDTDAAAIRARVHALGSPVFVKPANLGSSVGITKVSDPNALDAAVIEALSYDRKVLVEEGIDAREIECSVLGNDAPRASIVGEIAPEADFYSYAAKYSAQSQARLLIPAPISAPVQESVRALAVQVYATLECAGMARVDFLLERGTDRVYVNEINTIPGFTSISMYPKLWEASGLPFRDLITELLDLAFERHRARQQLRGGQR